MKTFFKPILIGILFFACSIKNQDSIPEDFDGPTLAMSLVNKEIALSSVIACAGSTPDQSLVRVYFYPRLGVTNIRYFETKNADVDPNDFYNYKELSLPFEGLFNDYLQFFEIPSAIERWAIITFEEEGVVNISNPIRLKQLTQATEYLPQNVSFSNETGENMPEFSWIDGTFDDSVIYFQVVATGEGDLLSGTYTFERNFQYYVLDNVVLNITREEPSNLDSETDYTFTLLSVTEDNWVNLFSEISFRLK